MTIGVDPTEFGVVEKALSLIGSIFVSIVTAAHFVTKRWAAMEDKIDNQDRRLTRIEDSYVSKDDLREVFDDLQQDVNAGFSRAHQRMDQLFTQLGNGNRPHGRDQ